MKNGNPFYILLLIAGVAFCLSACTYGVMMVKRIEPHANPAAAADAGLVEFVAQHGAVVLTVELIALALCTVAAMATDSFWSRRAEAKAARSKPSK